MYDCVGFCLNVYVCYICKLVLDFVWLYIYVMFTLYMYDCVGFCLIVYICYICMVVLDCVECMYIYRGRNHVYIRSVVQSCAGPG